PWLHDQHAADSAALGTAGIDHKSVPGPAVELAIPATHGIPATDRRHAPVVTFRPGQLVADGASRG
ncbi:MAG TPA: hypothetical protein VGM93_13415, partial [Acidimicrobiales bacterium]